MSTSSETAADRQQRGSGNGQAVEADRRAVPRFPGKADATVIRDRDQLRRGIEGKLYDISAHGLSLLLPVALEVGEYVIIRLQNTVQRVATELRAQVRHVQPPEDGYYRVGCAPMTRLSVRELDGLRSREPSQRRRPR